MPQSIHKGLTVIIHQILNHQLQKKYSASHLLSLVNEWPDSEIFCNDAFELPFHTQFVERDEMVTESCLKVGRKSSRDVD